MLPALLFFLSLFYLFLLYPFHNLIAQISRKASEYHTTDDVRWIMHIQVQS